MKKGIGYYVMTSGGSVVKLGSVVTDMNITLRSVRDELGRGLGIGGWNYVEVGGKDYWVEGPGVCSEHIIDFRINRVDKVMYLELGSVDIVGEVPRIVGYVYGLPDKDVNVIEYAVSDEEIFAVDNSMVYDVKVLQKIRKSELLAMIGEVSGGELDKKLTKSELIEYIINVKKGGNYAG